MILRPATPADAAAICGLWNPEIAGTAITFNSVQKTPRDIEEMLQDRTRTGHAFLLLEDAGTLQGFGLTFQFRGGIGYRHTAEHTIVLAPQARGQGQGRRLMAALEDHARKQGIHALFAGVSAENPAGVAFHKACGFAEVARLPEVGRKFDRWMDLILLQKML